MIIFSSFFLNTLVDRIGMALIHFLWQGAAIAVLLAVVLRILRNRSPQSRYITSWTALLAMTVCLPITAYYLPSTPRVEVTTVCDLSVKTTSPQSPRYPITQTTETELRQNAPNATKPENIQMKFDAPIGQPAANPLKASASGPLMVDHREKAIPELNKPAVSLANLLQPALPWIVGIWLFGSIALALWHLGGFRHLVRMKRRGTAPAPVEIEDLLLRLSKRLGIRQAVSVLISQIARVPAVLGWLRPVILLPASILGEMPPEQLEMILAHELAHIRRYDYLWNLLQIAIETVLFYHPAVWWVSHRIREERENCCDRHAVSAMGNPLAYAGALMRLAEIRCQLDASAAPAATVAADGGSLESRIRRVLGLPVAASCGSNAWLGGVFAVLLLATFFFINITWAGRFLDGKTSDRKENTAADSSLSMTAEAFAKLSDAEQRNVLVKAFEKHLENGKNLFYETEQIYRATENNNGKPGKPIRRYPPYFRYVYRYWRMGDSYKTEMHQYDNPNSLDFYSYSANVENAEEGIGRNASIYKGNGQNHLQGQVVYPRKWESDDRFHALPSPDDLMTSSGTQQYFFQYLADKKDKFEIKSPVSGDKIQLTLPWHGEKQVFLLDPQKDFLPIQYQSRRDIPATKEREALWFETKFEVVESQLEGNVWMPVKMVRKSTSNENILTIQETKILRFESGSVKPSDLLLPFTEGMQVYDVIEGISYKSDAQGNAVGPVKDDPNWKHEPPKGWHLGKVEKGFSLLSKISAADRKQLESEREAKEKKKDERWKPIDAALKVLKADPPAAQDERIEAAMQILRAYQIGERPEIWTFAIRELITIGKPAVPKLIEELDRTEKVNPLRAWGYVLRGIEDPRAIPALIRAIPRAFQAKGGDYGLIIKGDLELLKFLVSYDSEHRGKDTSDLKIQEDSLFHYGSAYHEIMFALEKLTGQSFNWQELNFASYDGGVEQKRLQRTLFLNLARRWADWWAKNWKNHVQLDSDAQLELIRKSLDAYAASIDSLPHRDNPNEIPTGSNVTIDGGVMWSTIEPYLDLDTGRIPRRPDDLFKNSPKDNPSPELLIWAEKEGIDLLRIEIKAAGGEDRFYGFKPIGMKVWRIDNNLYQNLEKEIQGNQKFELPSPWEGPIANLDEKNGQIAKQPASFLFITREGTCGAMQITSPMTSNNTMGYNRSFEYKFIFEKVTEKSDSTNKRPATTPAKPADTISTNQAKSASEPAPILLSAKGTVLDENGQPLADARVYLREWSTYRISTDYFDRHPNDILAEVRTDDAGAFIFQEIPAKTLSEDWIQQNPWDIVVVAPGYAIAWQHFSAPKMSQPLSMKLKREAKITGHVVDDKEQPVEGVEVKVADIAALGSDVRGNFQSADKFDLQCSRLDPVGKTDAEGNVTIGGLPVGCCLQLLIEDDRYRRDWLYVATTEQPQSDLIDKSYDSEKKKLTKTPYKVFATNFTTQLKPPYPRIVGRVTAADTGKPLPFVKIDVTCDNGMIPAIADENGKFVVKHNPFTRCNVHVFPPKDTDYLGRNEPLVIPQDKKEMEVNYQLPRGEEVRGQVIGQDTGQGVPGVNVMFRANSQTNTEGKGFFQASGGKTDADGKFRILVPPENGKVILYGPGMNLRGYDVPHFQKETNPSDNLYQKEVEVIAGRPIAEVEFAIPPIRPGDAPPSYSKTPPGPPLEGRAVDADGKPVANAEVGLKEWFDKDEHKPRIARTDANGRFTLRNIFTNEFEQIKIVHLDRNLCGGARLPKSDRTATADHPLEIKLSPAGSLSGRVMEGDRPIAGANVQVDSDWEGGQTVNFALGKTDEDGRYRFAQIPAGEPVHVHIFFHDYEYAPPEGAGHGDSQQVLLKPGENLELKPFQFIRSNMSVSGIVVDPDGKPVEGATVSVQARSGSSFYGAFTQNPTGKDGRFTITKLPNVPLKVMAYIRPPKDSPDNRIHFPATVDADSGQQDVEIVLDPKLARGKK